MPVLIANTVPASVNRLDAESARQAWAFVGRFMENPAHPGLSLERVQRARTTGLWSARVSQATRAIVHQEGENWTILCVGRHDDAYDWATSRRVERHVVTGALQVVVAPETVEAPTERMTTVPVAPGLFDTHADDYLVSLGLPPDWLPTIRQVRSDDDLLDVLPNLPEEVAERFLILASGRLATPPAPIAPDRPVLESADARRRFFLVQDTDDFQRLLQQPLAAWIAFLHESQRRLATGSFNGPLKVTGSAGTGKTTVALHRSRHLARQGKRVLVTSFVGTLCKNLERNLRLFCTPEEMSRITVATTLSQAMALVRAAGQNLEPVGGDRVRRHLDRIAPSGAGPLSTAELLLEWEQVVQAHGITSWEQYRSASRVGRGRPLTARERKAVWDVFEQLYERLQNAREVCFSDLCRLASEALQQGRAASPFDAVIVDEVQDLAPQEIAFLARLAGPGPDRLTLVGDVGQRIYGRRFTLKSLGVDVRGRSHVLKLNYRTTEQIRQFADRLARANCEDMDDGVEDRTGTVSLVSGPKPQLRGFASVQKQSAFLVEKVRELLASGLAADEIGVFTRHNSGLPALETAFRDAEIPCFRMERNTEPEQPAVQLGTMHRAKGLEFKVVFAVNVARDELPSQQALAECPDEAAREDAVERERQLLYVSVTRARDEVFLTWAGEPSPLLPDAA